LSKMNEILIIGPGNYANKIEGLLSKSGFKVSLVDAKGVKAPSSGLIIEAIEGSTEQKAATLKSASSAGTILATTLSGGVTQIAALTGHPERTIGLHFIFNPNEEKCLVEMAKGLDTSPETADICQRMLEMIDATVVSVEDISGLIVDRVMASVINEAAFMFETKLASMEDINRIPKLCFNWPLGPFEFADIIGVDNIVATLEAASHNGQQYLPCRLLKNMVTMGRLGKKTGRGFYEYSEKA
jgi:3-hydroxybutyryl-CoA dehydrogenase